ncbi:IclR family transcriptional regulator [Microvirga tunisiensis]|uniref:IclR family transcriptional regulator n=1 Tax=Microvirga tunisiensis TaxID=2108360 RepID=A0A5N7MQF1_9HYPH|nr:IclR family transcriptional regulator [Microvirga tunisiensis]MPR07821.1 IclR family transcriptional regulator [Microvirga tunisiensis]MPR26216.1 IclR family transcriptional regulator [Microvirga tunisiensis]
MTGGTQSLERACGLLKMIARHGTRGTNLSWLSASSGLAPSTCHRMLQALADLGLVHFEPRRKAYRIGPLAYELGLVAVTPFSNLEHLTPIIARVAEETEDTAYLMIRRGLEMVCLVRAEGTFIINANVIEVGVRRPVCDSVAGIAIASALPEEEAQDLVTTSAGLPSIRTRLGLDQVQAMVLRARASGIAYWNGVVMPDVAGAAVPVPNEFGRPHLAIAVSALASRLPEARTREIHPILSAAGLQVAERMSTYLASK